MADTQNRTPRVPITVLVRPESRDWLDSLAHKHHLRRNEVTRAALAVAKAHSREVEDALKTLKERS